MTIPSLGRATATVVATMAALAAIVLLVPVPMHLVVALLSLPLGASLFSTASGHR